MRRPSRRGERGSAALELVLLTPLLIALIFGLVQAGLLWTAQHLTTTAAQHGARLARTAVALQPLDAATPEDADEAVRTSTLNYLRHIGGRGLRHATVRVSRTAEEVTVTVTATTAGVLPGTDATVTGTSRTPVEGFRP